MSRTVRVVLTFAAFVVVFDAAAALAARALGFDYGALAVASWLIYAAAGFVGAERGRWGPGILAGATTGLTDATLGWAVSWAIGPGRPAGGWHPALVGVAVSVVLLATLVSLAGAGARQFVTLRRDRPATESSPPPA